MVPQCDTARRRRASLNLAYVAKYTGVRANGNAIAEPQTPHMARNMHTPSWSHRQELHLDTN